ncbi:MAG TPA: ATP-binding protein [Pyrinomonadaceae bacterium]
MPLPFLSKFLVLMVRRDRGEGFKQLAFIAAERKLQRRAVIAALIEIVINDLKADSLGSLSDVTERLNWTTGAPAELPEELITTLPRFDRVAQHVGQYLTLNSPYRRTEALGRALNEIEVLQRFIVVGRGRHAARLLQVANEWRRLLDEESEKVKALPRAMREIPNPFMYGNAVVETEHNVFAGRRDVVRQIEASLLGAAQAPTLLLQGPRRMGKTSILNQLPRLLGPDFAPAVVDCQNPAVTGSEATLLRYLSRALSEGLRRRRVPVEGLSAQQLAREPYAVFDEWLEKVERAMPSGMRALLCLDEYERLQAALEAGWGGPFLDALRHTFQHRPRVVLMFTGAHTFQELGPAWTDRFISARRMRVSFLGREDVELLLTRPIPEFDMTYAPGALDAMVAATNCHPFLTQAVAFELVQLLNEGQRREATTADVGEAVGRALVSGDAYFVNVWGDAGAGGQAILRALAAGEPPPDLPAARAWLREHDVIGADGDFAVEMMRRWVAARTSPAQRVME